MHHLNLIPSYLLLTILFPLFNQAQEKESYQLDPVEELLEDNEILTIEELLSAEIQATDRIRVQKNTRAPATVVIISEEQIRLRNYQSLLDVLQDQSDIKIDYGVDPRWMNDVSIRGIRGMDKFIILLDGIRISSPTNELIPIMQNYPVHFARQIEIVYGPASALYGADAFAGIINIITKEATELEKVNVTVQGGTHNQFLGNIYTGVRLSEKVGLTLSGQYAFDQQPDLSRFYPEEYGNIEQTLRTGTFQTIFGPVTSSETVFPDNTTTPLSAYALQGNLDAGRFRLSFFKNYSVNPSTQAIDPNNGVYNRGAFFGHGITMLTAQYTQTGRKLKSTTILTGSQYRLAPLSNFRNVFSDMNTAYKYGRGWMLKGEQLFNWSIQENINLTFGGTYEDFLSYPRGHDLQYPIFENDPSGRAVIVNSVLENNPEGIEADIPRVAYNNTGGLLQLQVRTLERITATIGARFDYNTRFGTTFNPRLGIVWEATEKTTLKALYGSAFLAPSPQAAFDQFGTFSSPDSGRTYRSTFFRLPNPDLEPQLIQTFELGANTFLSEQFGVSFSGFYAIITGLFTFVPDAGNTNLYDGVFKGWPVDYIEVTINQGTQQNYGGTVRFDYLKKLGVNSRLTAYAMLSVVTGTVDTEVQGDSISNREIPAYAPLTFRTGVDLRWKRWGFSPRLILTSAQRTYAFSINNPEERQTIAGFALLNVNLEYQLPPYATFYVDIDNALDQRYRHVNLGAAPDSRVQGAASSEIQQGMPQYPIRIAGGVKFRF